jgi:hypothetical protein
VNKEKYTLRIHKEYTMVFNILYAVSLLTFGHPEPPQAAAQERQAMANLARAASRARADLAILRKDVQTGRITKIVTYYVSTDIATKHDLTDKQLESQGETRSIQLAKDSALAATLIRAIDSTKLSNSRDGHGDLRFGAIFLGQDGKRRARVYVAEWPLGQIGSNAVEIHGGMADWLRAMASSPIGRKAQRLFGG